MNKIIHIIAGKPILEETYHCGCTDTLSIHNDRVEYFLNRMDESGYTFKDAVVTIVNADDSAVGKKLIDILMPGNEKTWQDMRSSGKTPYGRGLANRPVYQKLLDIICPEAGTKLRGIQGKAVIVVDYGVIEIFDFS